MSVKERLKKFIEYLKIGQGAFEKKVGLSNGYVNNIRKSIQPEKLQSIVRQYPELNAGWLMTGEGDMLKSEKIVPSKEKEDQIYGTPKPVPFWNLPVSAGKSVLDIVGKTEPDGFIEGLPGADIAENILPVIGTSMEPEVSSGAIIGVRKMHNWESLNTERIYLIITTDDRMIKRIEYDPENKDILWCVSPNYPKFKIFKSDVIDIQRVCFVYNPK
jgi:hypothetical protein